MMDNRLKDVLDFWYRELSPQDWFGAGELLDDRIRERFADLHQKACDGTLDHWADTPLGRLALILLLDQFSRHIHRGSPLAYAADSRAQDLAISGIDAGMDQTLALSQRQFFYMPLMHAEDAQLQARCVELFTALRMQVDVALEFAVSHKVVIDDFGRFPHRNAVLERETSEAEAAYLRDTSDNW